MNISLSSITAIGLAAALGVSGFAYLDLRNQLNRTEERMVALKSERDQLNKQVEDLKQQVNTSKKENSDLQDRVSNGQSAIAQYQGHIQVLSTCLQGVVQGMNELSQGDEASALLTFSSVSEKCREAGKIIEQQNSPVSGQGQHSVTTQSINF